MVMQDHQSCWLTDGDMTIWFNQWRIDLAELGFAKAIDKANGDGSIKIPPDQLAKIINIDETALSLDGNQGRCGGRPPFNSVIPTSKGAVPESRKVTKLQPSHVD